MTDKAPAQLADDAAEAIRALNHRTRSPQADWEYPGDAYDVVGNLSTLAMRLPQLLEQIANHIKALEDADHLKSDKHQLDADLVATYDGLTIAAGAAETLRGALDRAHGGLSSIAYKD
ncbi:hypothetical protein [Streptomyces sp. CoH27]|uniref:hypothetical protein n=1 Tax=Streptomyces sp. CoH27 TaxID=2875763 RepID=UPI001CD2C65E|nr:hypothetical protein [Streptomyces sp. CoH27]